MTEHAQHAADLLGPDHPLPRLADAMHAVRRQSLVCASFTSRWPWCHGHIPPAPYRSPPVQLLVDCLLLVRVGGAAT